MVLCFPVLHFQLPRQGAVLNYAGEAGSQGGQRLYGYFVAASPAVMVTAVMSSSTAKSYCRSCLRPSWQKMGVR